MILVSCLLSVSHKYSPDFLFDEETVKVLAQEIRSFVDTGRVARGLLKQSHFENKFIFIRSLFKRLDLTFCIECENKARDILPIRSLFAHLSIGPPIYV